MTFFHKYSLADLENLLPFELDIYTQMVKEHLAAKEEKNAGPPPQVFTPPHMGLT
jgi:hypothetical protein